MGSTFNSSASFHSTISNLEGPAETHIGASSLQHLVDPCRRATLSHMICLLYNVVYIYIQYIYTHTCMNVYVYIYIYTYGGESKLGMEPSRVFQAYGTSSKRAESDVKLRQHQNIYG